MKYLGAYLLANLGGKDAPSSQDILNILKAGEVDCDMEEANKIVNALAGKKVVDVIAEGKKKLASVPSGGSASAAAAPAAASAAAPKAEEKKKEEPKEESDDDMGFGLFD